MLQSDFVPILGFAQLECELPFAPDVGTCRHDVVSRRQLWSDRIGIDEAPILQMGISVGEQNVDEQAPGEMLCAGQWPAGKLVEDLAYLIIISVPVFLMSVLKKDLRKVLDVRSARSLSVEATHGVGV